MATTRTPGFVTKGNSAVDGVLSSCSTKPCDITKAVVVSVQRRCCSCPRSSCSLAIATAARGASSAALRSCSARKAAGSSVSISSNQRSSSYSLRRVK